MAHVATFDAEADDGRERLRDRLSVVGWGLAMAWSGALLLLPGDLEPLWHAWLLGLGLIVLGVGLAAARLGSRPGWDTWLLAAVGIVSGAAGLLGFSVSVVGLALLLFGLAFVLVVVRAATAAEA